MKKAFTTCGLSAIALVAFALLTPSKAAAQDPILTPVVVNTASTAVPIVVSAIAPKPIPGTQKVHGFVMNANSAQVTVQSKDNPNALQTFPLSADAATKMQKIIDKGGYQYGDKITVTYDTKTHQALKFKGKHSGTN
jgi:hypothetical protein